MPINSWRKKLSSVDAARKENTYLYLTVLCQKSNLIQNKVSSLEITYPTRSGTALRTFPTGTENANTFTIKNFPILNSH